MHYRIGHLLTKAITNITLNTIFLKKLLIIPSWQVWPLNSGGANAQTFLLNEISELLEVHIILSSSNTNALEQFKAHFPNVMVHWLNTDKTEEPTLKDKLKKLIFRITNRLLTSKTENKEPIADVKQMLAARIKQLYTINKPLSDKVKTLDQQFNYDFIQYEMEGNIPLIMDYQPSGKKIIILHEVTSKIVKQTFEVTDKINSNYAKALIQAFESYEENTLKLFDQIVVFNQEDSDYIQKTTANNKVKVSPYTVPLSTNFFKPNLKQYDLTFIGSGHHYPNMHGLEWFLSKVFPQIEILYPHIKIFITGQWQITFQKRYLNCKNIIFVGNLSKYDFNELLRCNIMVSPIFIGSGLRTKLMDNLQIGVPTVCTFNEQKAIPQLIDKENIMLADTPDEFAQAVNELLTNSTLRIKISENAKAIFSKYFSISTLSSQRINLYK